TVADTAGNTASATATIKAINDNLKTVNLTTTPLAPYNFSYVAGTGGPDTFAGGSSNDVFVGGGGGDLLNGGGGRDIFLYSAVTDSQPGTGNFDTISGFNTLAKIDLSEITGAVSPANISSLTSAPASVNANSVVWYYNSTLKQTVVYINPTSSSQKVNSTSIMEINLAGNQTA